MSHLLDVVVEVLGYFLSWRAWLSLVVGVIVGYALSAYGVSFVWPFDMLIAAGLLGLVGGLFWDARVG